MLVLLSYPRSHSLPLCCLPSVFWAFPSSSPYPVHSSKQCYFRASAIIYSHNMAKVSQVLLLHPEVYFLLSMERFLNVIVAQSISSCDAQNPSETCYVQHIQPLFWGVFHCPGFGVVKKVARDKCLIPLWFCRCCCLLVSVWNAALAFPILMSEIVPSFELRFPPR